MDFYLLTYTGSLKGESGERVNAKYDLSNACNKCGTGAILNGNLPIRTPDKKEFFKTFEGDLIISERIYNEFIKSKILGIALKRIVHYKKNTFLPYYHLISSFTLPKMSTKSIGFEISASHCNICNRDGYYDNVVISENGKTIIISNNYIFEIIDKTILNNSDIFCTWECFGRSWLDSTGDLKYHFARPRLIVSKRVKEVFEILKIKFANFQQVTFTAHSPILPK